MEISRRRLLGLAGAGAAAAITGVLAGCSSTLPEPDVAAAGFGARARGTVSVWSRSATQTGMQTIIDRFHKVQSAIRVQLTPVLDAEYVTKLATAIRGGEVPDLVDMDDINSSLFIYRDTFTDLTPLVDELPYRDKLSPGHLSLASLGKKVYGVPFLADNSLLWLNTELFDRAGVDPDEATQSLETLQEALPKLTSAKDGIYAWTFPGNGQGALGFTFLPHLWAQNADVFRGEIGSQTGFIEKNDKLRTTLEFFRRMWRNKWAPPSCYADAATHWGSDFLAGKIAIFPGNFAVIKAAPKAMAAKLKPVVIPGPTGGRCFFDGGDNLCMPRGAKNPSAAWEFAKFALETAQQQSLPDGGYTPIRSDADTAAFRAKYPLDTTPLEHLDLGYAPRTLAYNLAINQADGPFLAMFRKAVFDGDVDGALSDGQAGFDRLLKETQA
ncbi:ABC transporter substrate-binding protein [Gryllotalpicola ginsengisoli]|uniref:ABC transporter substrate-binding protein n=1 Tax=Gryllotalpicola ginsengisoli TaxID=444608 RepID=UPI0004833AB2|nr:sugar ABC transporter substrate-binding protein [Gryllotalpicola ginsengisoli]